MSNPDTPEAQWGTVETSFAPIHSSARMRDVDEVKHALEAGVEVDLLNGKAKNGDGGNTALWFACQGPTCGLEVAKLLVEAGANVNLACEHGRTPLHMAAAWGQLDVVQFLVEAGAKTDCPNSLGQTPLEMARKSERVPEERTQAVVAWLSAR